MNFTDIVGAYLGKNSVFFNSYGVLPFHQSFFGNSTKVPYPREYDIDEFIQKSYILFPQLSHIFQPADLFLI